VWTVFPIKFALHKTGVMNLEIDVTIGCALDIVAKVSHARNHAETTLRVRLDLLILRRYDTYQVIFGLILVGSREAMEGEQTPIALFSLALIGLTVRPMPV
jgi:hypothetical protein